MTRTCLALVAACVLAAGCNSRPAGTSDPEGKLRLERFLQLYKLCALELKKPPANEAAFRGWLDKLPPDAKAQYKLDAGLDDLFVSPDDGQKYVVRYGLAADGGESRKLAWEAAGKDGRRYVALTMGYVERYDDGTFKDIK